ncbi:hypothetical protein BGZ75_002954, partial [Mortierella antarctica]
MELLEVQGFESRAVLENHFHIGITDLVVDSQLFNQSEFAMLKEAHTVATCVRIRVFENIMEVDGLPEDGNADVV